MDLLTLFNNYLQKKYVKSAQSEDKPGGACEAWIDIGEYEIMILSHNHILKTQTSDLND